MKMNLVRELPSLPGPELVIGLIGPVGADLELVIDAAKRQLDRVGYKSIVVRVSELITNIQAFHSKGSKTFDSAYERIDSLMDAGSALRRGTGRGDALALMTVAEIRRLRTNANRKAHPDWEEDKCAKTALTRTAYIIRSLKNPSEVRTLRDVYGRAFFVVSAYSPRSKRVTDLAEQISISASDSNPTKYRDQAERLIGKDESEGDKLGQNVRDSFPLADLFVDLGDAGRVEPGIERFVELLFGNPFHTPTRDEFAMFHAHATALRSADLSRQVGAAIATTDGQILAVGCNEVPKFGGGHYWPADSADSRDFRTGHDSGTTARIDIVSEIIQRLQEANLLAGELKSMKARRAAEELILGNRRDVLAATQVLSVIEYGRAVHAEMAAITDAARRGVSVQGATLYCTAFPCHLCARHIIAAGIERVVYIEPYPKSIAGDLFGDSMVVDSERPVSGRVSFQSFVGIAPIVYAFMFRSHSERKKPDGTAVKWNANDQNSPRFRRFVPSYLLIEDIVSGSEIPTTFVGDYAIIESPEEND